MWNYRMQRDFYRAQRRAYRRQMRGYYGGGGFSAFIVLAIILISFSHLFWMIFPLVFFGIPFFIFVLRPLLFGSLNQTPYNQQYQPYRQDQMYQSYQQQQPQEDPPAYQPYSQGYQPQQPASKPAAIYQESGQQDQYAEQQTQQYEEPLTMYPRE
jgi:multisubunit Na+/H+ antiporter MnhG subunit